MAKTLWFKYRHIIPLLVYGVLYFSCFVLLEHTVVDHYTVIHMKIDDYIPFLEVFIIPYLLWFPYVAVTILFFFFKDKTEYYKACAFLFIGMTVFLIVSALFPNGHHLRPVVFPRNNIFTDMLSVLYSKDTSTNIVPSIHVFNAVGTHISITKSQYLKEKRGVQIGSFILSMLIVFSTMFIKQHSVFDVLTAGGMVIVVYVIVYGFDFATVKKPVYQEQTNGVES